MKRVSKKRNKSIDLSKNKNINFSKDDNFIIYGLRDPETDEYKYVGTSTSEIKV